MFQFQNSTVIIYPAKEIGLVGFAKNSPIGAGVVRKLVSGVKVP